MSRGPATRSSSVRARCPLAAQYRASRGTYVYGRERLGPWWGFLAGWGVVVGKTASFGACGCLVLVVTLPWPAVGTGVGVFAAGLLYRSVRLRGSRP